jgi:hypothetical protein
MSQGGQPVSPSASLSVSLSISEKMEAEAVEKVGQPRTHVHCGLNGHLHNNCDRSRYSSWLWSTSAAEILCILAALLLLNRT